MKKFVSSNLLLRILVMTILSLTFSQSTFGQIAISDGSCAANSLPVSTACSPNTFLLPGAFANSGESLSGCQSQDRDDGWFKFTGTGGTVLVTSYSSDQRHVLAIYSGTCGPGTLSLMKCEEAVATTYITLSVNTAAATTYYIQIHRSVGTFTTPLNGTVCVQSISAPGGVSTNIGSWYSADGPITYSGGVVSKLKNNICTGPDATNSSGTPTFTNNFANFNPAIVFDNSDVLHGPCNGTTFTGTTNGTAFIVNNYHTGAIMVKWEETGVFMNRVSIEGMTTFIRYDHPDRTSYMMSTTDIRDEWYLTTGIGTAGTDYMYVNGLQESSDAGGTNTPANMGSIMFGANTNGSFPATFDFAEVIYYTNNITAAEQNKVESYLATKYGITLGKPASTVNYTASTGLVFWNGISTYQNDIAGIGRDDAGNLSQEKSASVNNDNIVTMSLTDNGGSFNAPNTFDNNLEFMLWGNDIGALTETSVEVPAGYDRRIQREWQVQETGTVGTVSIQFNISTLTVSGTTMSDFALIIDEDKDANFLTGPIRYVTPTSYAGGILQFDGVNFANGEIFSLATHVPVSLPVNFVNIDVEGDDHHNIINWVTGEIKNSDHFEILKSIDGWTWVSIGQIKLSPNTTERIFSYIDTDIRQNTTSYYRIKEVGIDGENTYSEIVTISHGDLSTIQFMLYPNPAKQNLYIQLYKEPTTEDNFEALFYTVDGKVFYRTTLLDQKSLIDLTEFKAGTYVVEIRSWNGSKPERKIVVIQ